jgi:hypothetical protein
VCVCVCVCVCGRDGKVHVSGSDQGWGAHLLHDEPHVVGHVRVRRHHLLEGLAGALADVVIGHDRHARCRGQGGGLGSMLEGSEQCTEPPIPGAAPPSPLHESGRNE